MKTPQHLDAAFKRDVMRACYDALKEAGFTRYRKDAVDWPLTDGFHCWVGLNTNLGAEFLNVNPFVGLHVCQIEKLWTGLKTGKYPAKYDRGVATYAIHMGTIAPQEVGFRFGRGVDIAVEARRLAHLYLTVGLPYSQSISSYEQLLPLLEGKVPMLGGNPERFAACLYLMGREDTARQFVHEFLREHRDYFEGFACPFLDSAGSLGGTGRAGSGSAGSSLNS